MTDTNSQELCLKEIYGTPLNSVERAALNEFYATEAGHNYRVGCMAMKDKIELGALDEDHKKNMIQRYENLIREQSRMEVKVLSKISWLYFPILGAVWILILLFGDMDWGAIALLIFYPLIGFGVIMSDRRNRKILKEKNLYAFLNQKSNLPLWIQRSIQITVYTVCILVTTLMLAPLVQKHSLTILPWFLIAYLMVSHVVNWYGRVVRQRDMEAWDWGEKHDSN